MGMANTKEKKVHRNMKEERLNVNKEILGISYY